MAVLLTCPNGHRWESHGTGSSACPVCGATGSKAASAKQETVSPDPATPSLASEPASPAADLPEQFGRYRVLKQLGKGGMGAVYLAHDTELDRDVALRVPHFSEDEGKAVRERFYREARSAATLHHLTQRQIATLVRKLAQALQEAHRRGVIHRDLKPSNIIISPRGEPVIMDFGLARRLDKDIRITGSGTIMGTPAYMSPEQVNGDLEAMGGPPGLRRTLYLPWLHRSLRHRPRLPSGLGARFALMETNERCPCLEMPRRRVLSRHRSRMAREHGLHRKK